MSFENSTKIDKETRFEFGQNWSKFLSEIDEERISQAEDSLRTFLAVDDLNGKCFLDIGSGSGLFSLAARRLGARVYSFDFDLNSVSCTQELRRRYFSDDSSWQVEQGSVLDTKYLERLGQFDVVYSWGVLHHTGQMLEAFANVVPVVAPGGKLFIAIYNDQGLVSRYWHHVKLIYNYNAFGKLLAVALHAPYLIGLRLAVRLLRGGIALPRGMSLWYDMLDWLGGFPFEVAKPEIVFQFFRDRGLTLMELQTCGSRMGCNEFVFYKPANSPTSDSIAAQDAVRSSLP